MKTLPVDSSQDRLERQKAGGQLPEFLLSITPPCQVQLVSDITKQTRPNKTKAELLADGQCEV